MTNSSPKNQQGFIALMSAIVIMVLLLAITSALGFSNFFTRFNILDSEDKEKSSALAEACADTAILNITQGTTPTALTDVSVGINHCTIVSATSTFIQTQACINKATTNLQITIDNNDNIISWIEVPNLSPNHPCL